MPDTGPLFDLGKALATVTKGRRAKWWKRRGRKVTSFWYIRPDGTKITDEASLERIRSLVIPPAWTEVRINPSSSGKIQAVGIDSTGRVQYRYHPAFSAKRQKLKFQKIERFGHALPHLRRLTNEHIGLDGLPREKVLAVVMRLVNSLYFRVGTDHSARHYKTFGVTTLQKKHLKIGKKGELCFEFTGKSHVKHRRILVDEELASIMKDLISLGRGRKLFRYMDDTGKPRAITPALINSYLKASAGPQFSSKDFRTWGGSVLAASELAAVGPAETETELKRNLVKVVKRVAEILGNTPSVCRASYIHPTVIEAYSKGVTIEDFRPSRARAIKRLAAELDPEEIALIKLFENYSAPSTTMSTNGGSASK
jgi:DNA topoisomerase I